ncbi:MAG: tyrosine-type recombinase/integrase [Clostridium sp.]|uniref:tyrosine-type recombinase/integrase n=1 Tax=Clostridium sp. TaxID=1506 RepID=UPI003EE60566
MLPMIMESFLFHLEGERRNKKTIESYRKNLVNFIDDVFEGREPDLKEYKKLTSEDFMKWVNILSNERKLSASTVNQRIATLRKFYTYLMGMKLVSVNVPQTIGVVKTDELYERPILDEQEVIRLINTAKKIAADAGSYNGYRDELIITMFLGTGLRIEELSNISVDDIDLETGKMAVVGKRGKKRVVYVPKSKLPMLESYIKLRGIQKNSKKEEALFLSRQKSKDGYRLSTDQIRRVVVGIANTAGVKKITPHSLRHTGATLQIKKGVDIMDVSKWLGHSTVAITEKIYVHQTNESAQRVADVFDSIF